MTFFDDAWLFCFFVVVCLLGVINMMMKNFSLLKTQWLLLRLIISLPLDPSARIASQNKFAALVVDEDQDGERNGRKPPVESVRIKIKLVNRHIMSPILQRI